ncbi:hypothetical protein JUJ52_03860 [Virgibacillus sp. AGTR]|uniref:hypothetical protein n=1 Tax=Virgibacillus sp. AGTR TaxID=2812055 RepID=UPI001D16431C|nr:hypothetical protein [Virgibacillus sp. AGTR]MCC2249095.1 hypothetical protein [Virgibacillus sp. AGTR]
MDYYTGRIIIQESEYDVLLDEKQNLKERVQELEEKLDTAKFMARQNNSYGINQMKRAERYKQAIEEATDILDDVERYGNKCATNAYIKLCEALKGES